MRRLAALILLLLPMAAPAAATAAGATEGPVVLPSGEYEIRLPEGAGPFPAVIYLHGWGGKAAAVVRNGGMSTTFLSRGYAIIAPQGLPRLGRENANWAVSDGTRYPRDDAVFLEEVLADAAAKGWIDRDRVLMTGFSRGGSMVWDIACHHPQMATAYAPVAGAFWEPMPDHCEAPVDLFHTHGWTDRTVPLEGRPLRSGRLVQGDVFQSLFILRATNRVTQRQSDDSPIADGLWWRSWTGETGARIDLMLHPGGHGVPPGWAIRAIDWFEARLAARAPCSVAEAAGTSASC